MLGLDVRAARYTWTVLLILGLVGIVYRIRDTLLIFVLALLFAYLLWPLVKLIDPWLPGRSRVLALAIVYVLFVGLLIVLGILIGSRVVQEAQTLANRLPDLISKLEHPITHPPETALQVMGAKILSILRQQIVSHSQEILALLPKAVLGVLSHVGVLLLVFLVPILSFFFLKDARPILNELLASFGEGPRREMAHDILADIHLLLAQYMRALLLLAAAVFTAYSSFLSLIGTPYAVLLAAIAFPLEFIPILGPLVAAAIIFLIAAGSGFHHLISILLFLISYRLFQDYILTPQLMSTEMELHPLLVIFGVTAGAEIAGIAGAFLSVPVLATVRILYRQLQKRLRSPAAKVV